MMENIEAVSGGRQPFIGDFNQKSPLLRDGKKRGGKL
jgi:hypothetical protein